MRKVLLLSGASSIHTIRWANGLASAGLEVHVVTQQEPIEAFDAKVIVHQFRNLGDLGYYLMAPEVSKLARKLKPDIINAHYASGYGTTARIINYHPYLLSVWGSDVYDFPYKSWLHKCLLRRNLLAADRIASTSHCMANQVLRLVPALKSPDITPFGVDMDKYRDVPIRRPDDSETITIGTVKVMAPKYGISTLIEAFALVRNKCLRDKNGIEERLRLRLVGSGPQLNELESLARSLGVNACTEFVGRVPHSQVPEELSKIDIYVALSQSDSESFGVAIIEASAAGRAVVVSDAGGLPEVVLGGHTGLVVNKGDPVAAAEAMETLLLDNELRTCMGLAGREHVDATYSWDKSIEKMLDVYERLVNET